MSLIWPIFFVQMEKKMYKEKIPRFLRKTFSSSHGRHTVQEYFPIDEVQMLLSVDTRNVLYMTESKYGGYNYTNVFTRTLHL